MPTALSLESIPLQLTQIVGSVFETMMSLEVRECATPWHLAPDRLTSVIQLTGEWNAAILFECDGAVACRFAERFLSMESQETVDDVVRDVLGELANMIGGNLKCALGTGIALSMPSVVDGSHALVRVCGAQLRECIAFETDAGIFWILVMGG